LGWSGFWREIRMSAQADTKGPDIFNIVLATSAYLAKFGANLVSLQHVANMLVTFAAKVSASHVTISFQDVPSLGETI
jgi:hypothetical protein